MAVRVMEIEVMSQGDVLGRTMKVLVACALTRAGMFPGKTLAGARARAGIAAGPRRVSCRFLP